MKKKLSGILLALCMALAMLTLLPTTAVAQNIKLPANGWYYLRAMNNYLNLDANGNAELRNKSNTATGNQAFYVQNMGNNQITLKTADGRFLGVDPGSITNGMRVKAFREGASSQIRWITYTENNNDIYSLRPSAGTGFVLNASGERNTDGTPIILWTYANFNAPNHAEFRFIPTAAPASSQAVTPDPAPAVNTTQQWATNMPTDKDIMIQTVVANNQSLTGFWDLSGTGPNWRFFSQLVLNELNAAEAARADRLFRLVHLGDGWYNIRSNAAGVLDVSSLAPGSYSFERGEGPPLRVEASTGGPVDTQNTQMFRFRQVGNGEYVIQPLTINGGYIQVEGGNYSNNGRGIVTKPGEGGQNAKWRIFTVGDDRRTLTQFGASSQVVVNLPTSAPVTQPTSTLTGGATRTIDLGAFTLEISHVYAIYHHDGPSRTSNRAYRYWIAVPASAVIKCTRAGVNNAYSVRPFYGVEFLSAGWHLPGSPVAVYTPVNFSFWSVNNKTTFPDSYNEGGYHYRNGTFPKVDYVTDYDGRIEIQFRQGSSFSPVVNNEYSFFGLANDMEYLLDIFVVDDRTLAQF